MRESLHKRFIRIWESLLEGSSGLHGGIGYAVYAYIARIRYIARAHELAHACVVAFTQRRRMEAHTTTVRKKNFGKYGAPPR